MSGGSKRSSGEDVRVFVLGDSAGGARCIKVTPRDRLAMRFRAVTRSVSRHSWLLLMLSVPLLPFMVLIDERLNLVAVALTIAVVTAAISLMPHPEFPDW